MPKREFELGTQKAEGKSDFRSLISRALSWCATCVEEEEEEEFVTNWDLEVNKFDDMGLKEDILRGIYGYGYKDPSPIQMKGILPVIQGKDTIA